MMEVVVVVEMEYDDELLELVVELEEMDDIPEVLGQEQLALIVRQFWVSQYPESLGFL